MRVEVAGQGANTTGIVRRLNQDAVNLRQPGGQNSELFLGITSEDGIPIDYILSPGNTRTCHTLIEERGEITELVQKGPPITPDVKEDLTDRYNKLVHRFDRVIRTGDLRSVLYRLATLGTPDQ